MTKHGKDYRGEDRTLEMIRERTTKLAQGEWVETMRDVENFHQECWNKACVELATEMGAEGLVTTAREIISRHSINEEKSVAYIHVDDEGYLIYGPTDEDVGIK